MEYLIVITIFLGAIYLFIRTVRREKPCDNGTGSCSRCSRITQPPAERLHQIKMPPKK